TTDGLNFESVGDNIAAPHFECHNGCGETTIRFKEDGTMVVLARIPGMGKFLFGAPPYATEFHSVNIDHGMGGPTFLPLSNDEWLIGTREYANERPGERDNTATVLLKTDDYGIYHRVAELPSGGDTSYPGMVIYNEAVWVSYYSSHEGKTGIYLSKIPLANIKSN